MCHLPGFEAESGDVVITKPRESTFVGTPLEACANECRAGGSTVATPGSWGL